MLLCVLYALFETNYVVEANKNCKLRSIVDLLHWSKVFEVQNHFLLNPLKSGHCDAEDRFWAWRQKCRDRFFANWKQSVGSNHQLVTTKINPMACIINIF